MCVFAGVFVWLDCLLDVGAAAPSGQILLLLACAVYCSVCLIFSLMGVFMMVVLLKQSYPI